MDLARAMSEVRSLPDEALQKELSQPTGMLPGYLILGEMTERRALRSGGGKPQRMSIAQEMLRGYQAPPAEKLYAEGGLVAATNPFLTYMEILQNPDKAAALQQEKINAQFSGQPPLSPLQALRQPSPVPGLAGLNPWQPGKPLTPDEVGGIAKLLR